VRDSAALDILLLVHLLFLISVASLSVLIGATAAIVHHIRVSHRLQRSVEAPPEPSFAEHLQAATEYGSPRSPRIVAPQSVQSISSKKDWEADSRQECDDAPSERPPSNHRSGLHAVRRSSIDSPAEQSAAFDKLHSVPAPRLRVIAGNRAASSKNP
jgi:hypothetical protein